LIERRIPESLANRQAFFLRFAPSILDVELSSDGRISSGTLKAVSALHSLRILSPF
jgi:hypothetical protein